MKFSLSLSTGCLNIVHAPMLKNVTTLYLRSLLLQTSPVQIDRLSEYRSDVSLLTTAPDVISCRPDILTWPGESPSYKWSNHATFLAPFTTYFISLRLKWLSRRYTHTRFEKANSSSYSFSKWWCGLDSSFSRPSYTWWLHKVSLDTSLLQ